MSLHSGRNVWNAAGRGAEAFGFDRPDPSREADDLAPQVRTLGGWYARSSECLSLGYEQWFHPTVVAVVDALLDGGDLDDAVVRLGVARAAQGFAFVDALTDWSIALEAVPGRYRHRLTELELTAAFAAGFDSSDSALPSTASPFGAIGDLRSELGGLYTASSAAGIRPADTWVLVLVEADARGKHGAERGAVAFSTAEAVREHFPLVEQVVCLEGGRFAVLARRHPGLAVGITTLERALRARTELVGVEVSMWLVPLPAVASALDLFLRRLERGGEAVWAIAHAASSASGADAGLAVHLADTPRPTTPLRPRTWAFEVVATIRRGWQEALAMITAAALSVVLVVALVVAVGPAEANLGPGNRSMRPFLGVVPFSPAQRDVREIPLDEAPGAIDGRPVPPEAAAAGTSGPAPTPTALPSPKNSLLVSRPAARERPSSSGTVSPPEAGAQALSPKEQRRADREARKADREQCLDEAKAQQGPDRKDAEQACKESAKQEPQAERGPQPKRDAQH